jgi:hypothetical protein
MFLLLTLLLYIFNNLLNNNCAIVEELYSMHYLLYVDKNNVLF